MAWNPFQISSRASVGGGGNAIINDGSFPFGSGVIYRNINVWVTTNAGASYVVEVQINGVTQDSQTVSGGKSVSQYRLDSFLVKDTSFAFQTKVTNTSTTNTNFTIFIIGEYFT